MIISTKNIKIRLLVITSAILAIFFVFSNLFVFNILIKINKKDIFQNINKKNNLFIEKLSFEINKKNLIHWKEIDKEFIFENRFYDIVKIEKTLDSITYYCVQDILEKKITILFSETIENSTKSEKNKSHKNLNFNTLLFFEFFNLQNTFFLSNDFEYLTHNFDLSYFITKPLFPPPKNNSII